MVLIHCRKRRRSRYEDSYSLFPVINIQQGVALGQSWSPFLEVYLCVQEHPLAIYRLLPTYIACTPIYYVGLVMDSYITIILALLALVVLAGISGFAQMLRAQKSTRISTEIQANAVFPQV